MHCTRCGGPLTAEIACLRCVMCGARFSAPYSPKRAMWRQWCCDAQTSNACESQWPMGAAALMSAIKPPPAWVLWHLMIHREDAVDTAIGREAAHLAAVRETA